MRENFRTSLEKHVGKTTRSSSVLRSHFGSSVLHAQPLMGDSRRRGETASGARVAGVEPPAAVRAFDGLLGRRETESLLWAGVSR